jgi:hypothetical protein
MLNQSVPSVRVIIYFIIYVQDQNFAHVGFHSCSLALYTPYDLKLCEESDPMNSFYITLPVLGVRFDGIELLKILAETRRFNI